ncbi:zinc finger protein CONSTANS-LIKE 4-like [Juglans microcarpa x Juglans regia]|uniref:zinc finger protein CONSTANS-LIKE 4-like n=1 Tax=Juglans microcarpa x Juglans regia TaxID=2249226 RepID=UPI001B7DC989|nr:zinc finger protein CONSTANS-LIKE 4-like [Juglans microcarpa x Juglans regia]XP_041026376.1 zinc finger protein CONSTANS-LIKE 4-like [Juglans microcarpa x Juglans regia]
MKKCELCDSPANLYCESDQASLCWDCDARVHGANFLVAKHSRTLLCHVCQSSTPWNGSGPKLGATISVCESCVDSNVKNEAGNEGNDHDHNGADGGGDSDDDDPDSDDNFEEEEDDDGHGDDDQGDNDEDEEENQVVPWSSTPPPPTSSSSWRGIH